MRKIYYQISNTVEIVTENKPKQSCILFQKILPYSKENEELARTESYNGEYSIEEDPEESAKPTQLDRIEAQVAYTAMMTDTLLEV